MASVVGTPLKGKRSGPKQGLEWDVVDMDSPQKVCKEGNAVWAEFDFSMDSFAKQDIENKMSSPRKSKGTSAEKDDKTKHTSSPRHTQSDKKKSSSSTSSREVERTKEDKSAASTEQRSNRKSKKSSVDKPSRGHSPTEREEEKSVISPERRSSQKSKKSTVDKSSRAITPTKSKEEKSVLSPGERSSRKSKTSSADKPSRDITPTKRESRRLTTDDSVRSRSPSVASRRREKTQVSPEKTPKAKEHRHDASQTPSRRRQVPVVDLSSSRTRAVQRAEARNSWRATHTVPKETSIKAGSSGTDFDDDMDAKARKTDTDEHRMLFLEQSRKGPVRVTSRLRSKREDYNDDDDDISILSASSSSFMLDEPFSSSQLRRGSCAGGYLPNDLSARVHSKKGRRASAFGSTLDRAHAIYNHKADESDDDESCSGQSAYTLPNGLSTPMGDQFDIDRSGRASVVARRPSLHMVLTVPFVNGSDADLSSSEHSSRTEKSDRSAKSKRALSNESLSGSTASTKPSSPKKTVRPSGDKPAEQDDKKGVNYDSAVDDMLKNRRLRGARGDAVPKTGKKKDEAQAPQRKLSLKLLSNLVHPIKQKSNDARSVPSDAPTKRPSRV